MSKVISHPLPLNTKIRAQRPGCNVCKNSKPSVVEGKILKVINNNSGFWYYLDNNMTVPATTVQDVIQ